MKNRRRKLAAPTSSPLRPRVSRARASWKVERPEWRVPTVLQTVHVLGVPPVVSRPLLALNRSLSLPPAPYYFYPASRAPFPPIPQARFLLSFPPRRPLIFFPLSSSFFFFFYFFASSARSLIIALVRESAVLFSFFLFSLSPGRACPLQRATYALLWRAPRLAYPMSELLTFSPLSRIRGRRAACLFASRLPNGSSFYLTSFVAYLRGSLYRYVPSPSTAIRALRAPFFP